MMHEYHLNALSDEGGRQRFYVIQSGVPIEMRLLQLAGLMLDDGLLSPEEMKGLLPVAQSFVHVTEAAIQPKDCQCGRCRARRLAGGHPEHPPALAALYIDFASKFEDLCLDQAKWSQATFGNDRERGPMGALKHLELEAREAQTSPKDITEYADCLLLLLDASRRAGFKPMQLIEAAQMKMEVNKAREWQKTEGDVPSQHIRQLPELGAVHQDGGYPQHVPILKPLREEVQADNGFPYRVESVGRPLVEGDVG